MTYYKKPGRPKLTPSQKIKSDERRRVSHRKAAAKWRSKNIEKANKSSREWGKRTYVKRPDTRIKIRKSEYEKIKELYPENTLTEIAKLFKVSRTTITYIIFPEKHHRLKK